MSQISLFKLKNSLPPTHRTDRRAILQSTTSNGCFQSAMRETKWHIKTTQQVSGRVLWNSGWRRSVCSTKLVYLGCNHVVCAYFALVCSSKLVHIFFGTAGYDLTWYILACNLRVPQLALTDTQCTKSILAHLEPKPFAMAQFKLVPSKTSMLGAWSC